MSRQLLHLSQHILGHFEEGHSAKIHKYRAHYAPESAWRSVDSRPVNRRLQLTKAGAAGPYDDATE